MTAAHAAAPARDVIRTPDHRLRVFISSTLGELADERAAARAAVEQLRLAPVMFELGARPHPPRALYRAYLEQSDVFVGIYWQRYGWVAPGMEFSGLEDEFRLSAGMPRLLYVKRPAPDMEPRLRQLLSSLQERDDAPSYRPFTGADELRALLVDDLAVLLAERFDRGSSARVGRSWGISASTPPVPPTRLVGRDADVEAVTQLLCDHGRRLVTITGVGGVGKTRLALAVLERTRARWTAGAGFIDASAVDDPEQLAPTIAVALGISGEGREQPLDALARRIAENLVLLVLDNLEQVVTAAPQVAALLARCRNLHVLVTSRVVLKVRGEQEWRLSPLELPDDAADPQVLTRCSAIEMFVDRARDVRPDFELAAGNTGVVLALCRRLDGLPLALELAAARLRTLSPEQALARLDAWLDLPTGLSDLPERQRTLAATIEWSRSLLDADARRLFARLSVFSGAFPLDAAEAVCGWGGVDAVEALSTLIDHSLVTVTERLDSEPGFRMLETVRAHAAEHLRASGEQDECRSRLLQYLVDLFAWAAPRCHGPEQGRVLRRLDGEVGNIVASVSWAVGASGLGPLLRGIASVWVWMQVRNPLRGMLHLDQLVSEVPAATRMTATERSAVQWLHAGSLLSEGRYDEVVRFLEAHLSELLEHEPPQHGAMMLTVLAISRPYAAGSPARGELARAMALLRDDGATANLGYTMAHYGQAALLDDDLAAARRAHEGAMALAQQIGDVNLLAELHYDLAVDDVHEGDLESARSHLRAATVSYRDLDHRDGLARCLAVSSALAFAEGDPARAAALLGTVAAAREAIELPAWPMTAEIERRLAEQVREALGQERFGEQLRSGRHVGLLEGVDAITAPRADQRRA